MDYIKTEDKRVKFTFEGLSDISDDVEYSISGMFRGDEYSGHIQFLWKPKGKKSNVIIHTGKDYIFGDRVSRVSRKIKEDSDVRDILEDKREEFTKIRDEIGSGKYKKLEQMLDDIDRILY